MVKGCAQVVNKSVVIAGWWFVDNAENQTGETTIKFMGSEVDPHSSNIYVFKVDLINAQTPPPRLSIRSRLADAYPWIQSAASSIFSFSHASVIKVILTPYWSRIIFKSPIFHRGDLVCERRKVSGLVRVLKFGEEFMKEILIKLNQLLRFRCTYLALWWVLCVNGNG